MAGFSSAIRSTAAVSISASSAPGTIVATNAIGTSDTETSAR